MTTTFSKSGNLPLHAAAREGFLPILKWLVEVKKVDVMQDNKEKEPKRALNIAR